VLKRLIPKVLRVTARACLKLSKIMMKKAIKPATLNKCPAETIACHPPKEAG